MKINVFFFFLSQSIHQLHTTCVFSFKYLKLTSTLAILKICLGVWTKTKICNVFKAFRIATISTATLIKLGSYCPGRWKIGSAEITQEIKFLQNLVKRKCCNLLLREIQNASRVTTSVALFILNLWTKTWSWPESKIDRPVFEKIKRKLRERFF